MQVCESLQQACLRAHACALLSLCSQRQFCSPFASVLPSEEVNCAYFGITIQAARERPDTRPVFPHSASRLFLADPHLPLLPLPPPGRRRGPARSPPRPALASPHSPGRPRASRCPRPFSRPLPPSPPEITPPAGPERRLSGQPPRSRSLSARCCAALPRAPPRRALPSHHEHGPRPGGSGAGQRGGRARGRREAAGAL